MYGFCYYYGVVILLQNSLQTPKAHHLAQPNLGIYKGGSLPNVNQIAANTIDLQVSVCVEIQLIRMS